MGYLRLVTGALLIWLSLGAGVRVAAQGADAADILRLINAGEFAAARALWQTHDPSPSDVAFLEGRVQKVQGNLDAAIDLFRQSLVLDPDNLAARRELAHSLLLAGQYDQAEFHFTALLAADPNTEMHAGYHQFLSTIRQNKPFGVSGHFALVPSTNVNRGTTNTVFDTASGTFVIDPNSQQSSGVGAQLGLTGYARFGETDQSRWTLSGNLTGTAYEDHIHNNATAAIRLTYERSFVNGRWSLAPYASYTWRADDSDKRVLGLAFGATRALSERTSLSFGLIHEDRRYPFEAYQNGPYNKATLTVAHQFSPSFAVRASLSGEQSRPEALHLQYDGYALGASLAKAWEGGLVASLTLEAGTRDFIGIYPLTTSPRSDDFASLSVSLHSPRYTVGRFTPKLTCSYTDNRSNVAFYTYDAADCQVSLTTEF